MVLDTVPSPHSKRNYAQALDDLFASVPADLSPGPYNGVAGGHGVALPVDDQRPALGRAQVGRRGQTEQHDRIGGGGHGMSAGVLKH
jgi:hypothetical protein